MGLDGGEAGRAAVGTGARRAETEKVLVTDSAPMSETSWEEDTFTDFE